MRIDVLGGGVNSAVGRAHIAAMKLDGSADIALARFANEEAVNLVSTESFGLQNTLFANSSVDFFSQASASVDLIVKMHNIRFATYSFLRRSIRRLKRLGSLV